MKCYKCFAKFPSISTYCQHIKLCLKSNDKKKCPLCKKEFKSLKVLKYHLILNDCLLQSNGKSLKLCLPLNSPFIISQSAFKKFLQVFTYIPNITFNDAIEFFIHNRVEIKRLLAHLLKTQKSFKIQ